MRPLALALTAALAGGVGPAHAGPGVTLNGVAIDGVTGQRFENATVVIDEKGDVHIEAKGYAVRTGGQAPRTAAAPRALPAALEQPASAGGLSRRYFLVTERAAPGGPLDLAIFINARWIREVKASEPQVVMEITRHLRPGANKVVLAGTRRPDAEHVPASKDAALHVVMGEGNVGGDHVMIDNPLVDVTRTAADVEDRAEEFVLEAR